MTIDELIEKAQAAKAKYSGSMDVLIRQESDDYAFSMSEVMEVRDISFYESEDDDPDTAAKVPCFVITDEA